MASCSVCNRVSTNMQKHEGKMYCYQCIERAKISGKSLEELAAHPEEVLGAIEASKPSLPKISHITLSASPAIDGVEIQGHLGLIHSSYVEGVSGAADIKSMWADNFGGRVKAIESRIDKAVDGCLANLKIKAAEMEAEAIVSVKIDVEEMTGGGKALLMVHAYGNAVKAGKR